MMTIEKKEEMTNIETVEKKKILEIMVGRGIMVRTIEIEINMTNMKSMIDTIDMISMISMIDMIDMTSMTNMTNMTNMISTVNMIETETTGTKIIEDEKLINC